MASPVEIVVSAKDYASNVLKNVSTNLENMGASADKAGAGVSKSAQHFDRTNLSLKSMAFTLLSVEAAIFGVATAAEAVSSAVFGWNSMIEKSNQAYTTLIGNADAADEQMRQMKDFAAKTPFEFEDVDRASKKLLAFGFAASEVIPTLTAVGNAAAALALPKDGIDRIILALGQMGIKAKLSAQEVRQLNEAGIAAQEYLAKAFNLTADAFDDLSQTGISGLQGMQAILDGMASDPKFANMMAKQATTFDGLWSTIKDTVREGFGAMTKFAFDATKDIMNSFAQMSQAAVGALREGDMLGAMQAFFSDSTIRIIMNVVDTFRYLGSALDDVAKIVAATFGSNATSALELFTSALSATAKYLSEFTQFLADNMDFAKLSIYSLATATAILYAPEIIAGIATTIKVIEELRIAMALLAAEGIASAGVMATMGGAAGALGSAVAFLTGPIGIAIAALTVIGGAIWYFRDSTVQSSEDVLTATDEMNTASAYYYNEMGNNVETMAARTETALDRMIRMAAETKKSLLDVWEINRYFDKAGQVGGELEDMSSRKAAAKKDEGRAILRAPRLPSSLLPGDGSSSGGSGADPYATSLQKMIELSAKLEEKIMDAIGTKPQAALAKLNKEIVKMENDIADAEANGVNATEQRAKLAEYAAAAQQRMEKDLLDQKNSFAAETAKLTAATSGDRLSAIQAEYDATVTSLSKQRDDWERNLGDKKLADERYQAELAAADKKRRDATNEYNLDILGLEQRHYDAMLDLGEVSYDKFVDLQNKKSDAILAELRIQLEYYKDDAKKRLEIEQLITDEQKKIRDRGDTDMKKGVENAAREIKNTTFDYKQNVLTAWGDITSSVYDNFEDMFTRAESFGEGMKNIFSDIAKAIQSMLARAIAYQLIIKPLSSWVSNITGGNLNLTGKANGGPVSAGTTYLVGEHGPELFTPANNGSITSNGKFSTGGNVTVNVINQTSQQVEAKQSQPSFDNLGNMVIDVVLSAVATNKRGMRDALAGVR